MTTYQCITVGGYLKGVCDGASVLILASEEAVKKHNLTPLARLVSYGISGNYPLVQLENCIICHCVQPLS